MKIVLIGFMCAGKSQVGRALAKKLKLVHLDTDQMIEKNVGASIADIMRKRGEKEFRAIEEKAVSLVAMMDNAVISTGGGVPMNSRLMGELSKDGKVVWLKVSPEKVLKRAGNLSKRPLIDPRNPLDSITKRLNERTPFYSKVPLHVDTDSLSVKGVVEKIQQMLKAQST